VITLLLPRVKPAAPRVDRSAVWTGRVERGSMHRQVRGSGRLAPEENRWIPARTNGRVESIALQPGAPVDPDTVILVLANPELRQAFLESRSQLKQAEVELINLRVQLASQQMNQQAEAARVESEYQLARLQAEAEESLAAEGLISEVAVRLSRVRADSWAVRRDMETKKAEAFSEAVNAQIEAKQEELEQRRALHAYRRQQLDSLQVRAGIGGVLQQTLVDIGQHVSPGVNLARVADPGRLMAELRVAATQARDLQAGQRAQVDTRNGVVSGTVLRVAPAVHDGMVQVDITLNGELPRGARPDLAVDGAVELEHLEDILLMPRPAFGQENAVVELFRVEGNGGHATRVPVRLGRGSVTQVEVLEGLNAGDEVILSDMSRWSGYDRIRLK